MLARFSAAFLLSQLDGISKERVRDALMPWRVEYFEREKPNADFLEAATRTSDHAAP